MRKTLKIFILLTLGFAFLKCDAQNTFLLRLKCNTAFDITEDGKNGFGVVLNDNVIRINNSGRILWEYNTNSPAFIKYIDSIESFVLPGESSGIGGYDMMSLDCRSNLVWDVYRKPKSNLDTLETIVDYLVDNKRKQIVMAGVSSRIGGKPFYWMAGANYKGKILWEKKWIDLGEKRYFGRIFKNSKTGGYILIGNDNNKIERHELFTTDTLGNVISRAPIEPNPESGFNGFYEYKLTEDYPNGPSIVMLNDTTLVATIEHPDRSFYFYKYNLDLSVRTRILGASAIQQYKNGYVIGKGGTGFWIYDDSCKMIFANDNIYTNKETEFVYIKKIYPSKDGGFYGIAEGEIAAKGLSDPYRERWVYIFKTDSLGRINNTTEYKEKAKPCMLQPNPASKQVRIAIPYYFGNIEAEFYSIQGQKMLTQTQNEANCFDIKDLSPGIYVVHARILETGEVRKMKLIVQ